MFKRLAILAALAAGTVLLTACNASMSASDATGATVDVKFATNDEESDAAPVDCGEVDVDGKKHTLTAQPAADGLVGCTEAFNVLDEYLKIPAPERGAALNGTTLSDGWSCTTDDGETTAIGCVKNRTDDAYGLAFSTTPR